MPPAAGESPGECEAGQVYYYLPKTQEPPVQGAHIGGHCQVSFLMLGMAAHSSVRGGGVAY